MLGQVFNFGAFLLLLLLVVNGAIIKQHEKSQILLIVSYDSFNKKYLELNASPTLNKVQEEGVSVPYLRNVFTTKTFPNHFSIATGLYPDRHGVTNNVVYDKKLGEVKYGHEYYHMDETVTPIWTLNEESGGHSACLFYPGSNFAYHNRTCTFTEVFTPKFDFKKRVDLAFGYILHPETPANLVMLYFEQPDDAGHKYGPMSKQVKQEVSHVDEITKLILEQIQKNKLETRLNVIFMSDHGMQTVKLSDMIDLRNYTDSSTYKMYGSSPVVQIVPNEGQFDNVLNSLREASKSVGHFNVYTNEELPTRWHYRNQRVGPITIVADPPYIFNDFYNHVNWFKSQNITKTNDEYGVHGYDNAVESMRAVFMGKGPALKTRFLGKPIDNIDLYYLFCKVLNLSPPRRLDGNEKNIQQFLVDGTDNGNKIKSDPMEERSPSVLTTRLAVIALLILISIITVIILGYMWYKRSRKRADWREQTLDAAFGDFNSETMHLITSEETDLD